MSGGTEPQKEVVRRYFRALDERDLPALRAVLYPDFDAGIPGVPAGVDHYWRVLERYHEGFSDLRISIDALVAEGEWVAALTTVRGMYTGTFLGHAPTGRSFSATGTDFFELAGARIAGRKGVFDTISMLIQLGLYSSVLAEEAV